MNDQGYRVEVISPEAAAELLQRFKRTPDNMGGRRSVVLPGGMEIKGEFTMTARDVRSGEVEWQHSEKNLITDFGRRVWEDTRWHQAQIGFAPSVEAPLTSRYSLGTDGSQTVDSGALTSGNTPATHTKTYSTTYATPASNRTLGTIALGRYSGAMQSTNEGLMQLMAYALLTPPKTQTTTQTLEVVYKVSMNPIS